MKLEEIVYDIKHLLNALTDDTRVSDGHLIFKINNYRDMFLREYLRFNKSLGNSFYQKLPEIVVQPISSGDLPGSSGSIKFGKATIPNMVAAEGMDEPLLNLYLPERHRRIYFIDRMQLMEMIYSLDSRLDYTDYYIYEGGNDIYLYPFHESISGDSVFSNPLEASKFNTTNESLASLTNGAEYIVTKGYVKQVTAADIPVETIYRLSDSFTADLNNSYVGDGKVMRTDTTEASTMQNEYPVTGEMAQKIIIQIITKDFQIERQSLADVFNDAKDQFNVVKGMK